MNICITQPQWVKVGSSCSITLHDVLTYNVWHANLCPRQFAGPNAVHTTEQLPYHNHTTELPITEPVFTYPNDSSKPALYAAAFPFDNLTIIHTYRGRKQQWATRTVRAGSNQSPSRYWYPWPTNSEWNSDARRATTAGWGAEQGLPPVVHGWHHIPGNCQCKCFGRSFPAPNPPPACRTPSQPTGPKPIQMNSQNGMRAMINTRVHPHSWQHLSCASRSLDKSRSDVENLRGERRISTQIDCLNRQKQRLRTAVTKKQRRANKSSQWLLNTPFVSISECLVS